MLTAPLSRWLRRVGFVLSALTILSAAAGAQEIRVTLLGTGCPPPVMNRFGPSILVEAGSHTLLFDAGRGALQRLAQRRVRWQDVDGVFFTHLHSDHVVGFPDLWLTGWLVWPGRDRSLAVWGPDGTSRMTSHLRQAYEFDIRTRIQDDRAPAEGAVILAEDITPGVVFESDELKVTAFEVDHDPVRPALGYRVDYRERSVVISGDTRPSDNVVRHARGVDLLVHEVVAPASFERAGVHVDRARSVIEHHATPEQAGEVFARAKPRLAVYSHIALPTATEEDLVPPTRKTYAGPLEVGEDLMVIVVSDEVEVQKGGRDSPETEAVSRCNCVEPDVL